jgi:hypothetical protein
LRRAGCALAKAGAASYSRSMESSRPMFFVSCLANVLLGSLLLRRAR